MMAAATTSVGRRAVTEDEDYAELHTGTRGLLEHVEGPLFTTDVGDLAEVFLAGLPEDRRQHYTCNACRSFLNRYAGLVTIDANGVASPALLGVAPAFFVGSIFAAMRKLHGARVTGVFLTSEAVLGVPGNESPKSPTGRWTHLHAEVPEARRFASLTKTAGQAMAEKREEHGMLRRGLAEFSIETARQAVHLLTNGGLFRSEKCIQVAKWFVGLHEALAGTQHREVRENLIWRAVALAPPGWAHIRSTMIGTLLEDIAAGKSFDAINGAFDAKMNPLQYQRPQAAPTSGQIDAAEKVIAQLGAAGSLDRRFARLDEVVPFALWTPKPTTPETKRGSVFGHLKPTKAAAPIATPAQPITWEKFARTVLPEAERIEAHLPARGPYFAFVTAANADARPILQWDTEGARNPVSWYVYPGDARGSLTTSWSLTPGAHVEVVAITREPPAWRGDAKRTHHGHAIHLVLAGARDRYGEHCGHGLFPEILKSELHGIRAAIEAYSRSKPLTGLAESNASGLVFVEGRPWNLALRVTMRGGLVASYRVDRWD